MKVFIPVLNVPPVIVFKEQCYYIHTYFWAAMLNINFVGEQRILVADV